MNPSISPTDSWIVTATGATAIVRSHDYHIDWINADGTKRSTPKMPFDWRRLTDTEKQAKIDSARRIIDSVTARGGYRLKSCAGGRSTSFSTTAPNGADGGDMMIVGGRGNLGGGGASVSVSGAAGGSSPDLVRAPDDCQTVTVKAHFVPLDSMADYIAPIREDAAHADMDGNVWILPTTSLAAKRRIVVRCRQRKWRAVRTRAVAEWPIHCRVRTKWSFVFVARRLQNGLCH